MDRAELKQNLESFRQACIVQGYIDNDKEALVIDESFPGMRPTSFIVNVIVRDEWLKGKHHRAALQELDDLLYKTTAEETLINILALRLYNAVSFDTFEYPTLERKAA